MPGARCQSLMMGSVATDGADRSLKDTEKPSVPPVTTDTRNRCQVPVLDDRICGHQRDCQLTAIAQRHREAFSPGT